MALILAIWIAGLTGALAQNVTVIGPITPGDCTAFNSPTVVKDGGLPCGAGHFANPTGAVGLTAVPGVATTSMRSDAAPPLSASVQSALTGTTGQILIGTGGFGFSAMALGGDCTFTSPNITCTKTSGVAFGTFATANSTVATAALNIFTSGLQGVVPASGGGTTNFLRADGTFAPPPSGSTVVTPQMRITLVSGLAVPTTDQVGIGTIFVTPAGGNLIPISNGSVFVPTAFAEVSQAATDTTKSPAAVANNSVYDIFCWIDTGPTNRCTRGPAWTNDTTRSAGTALNLNLGIWVNAVSITNGPAAGLGTYVGSCRSNGTATFDLKFGTPAAGGGQAWFSCWNMYNRAPAGAHVQDTNASSGVATVISAFDSAGTGSGLGNRISILHGIDEDAVDATFAVRSTTTSPNNTREGFCLDSTSAFTANSSTAIQSGALDTTAIGRFSGFIGLGFHFLQACEVASTTGQNSRQADGLLTTAIVWW